MLPKCKGFTFAREGLPGEAIFGSAMEACPTGPDMLLAKGFDLLPWPPAPKPLWASLFFFSFFPLSRNAALG